MKKPGVRRLCQEPWNGTSTDYSYDGFRRVSAIDHLLPSGTQSLHKLEYAYDKVHNRRMEKNTFDATWMLTQPAAVQTFLGARAGKGDVYAYDMAYRMIDARYDVTNPLTEVATPGSQAYVRGVGYTIDGLGNRSQTATTLPPGGPTNVTYAADVMNQYTALGGVTRTHDSNGNLTDDGTNTFHYDFKNRLTEVKLKATSASIVTYKYDTLGRRVEKAVVAGAATTRYVLDGQQVVEEFDGTDTWQASCVYEDGIDQPRCMDRADIADVDGDLNTAEVFRFHYHQNALGSVYEMTDPTGAVVEWVTYDVYGAATVRNQVGTVAGVSAIGNPFLYTGREFDPESGQYFYRARTYDPGAGRFLQRDPLGYVDGMGLNEYVGSGPVSRVDPLGEDDQPDHSDKLDQREASRPEAGDLESTLKRAVRQEPKRDLGSKASPGGGLSQEEKDAKGVQKAYKSMLDAFKDESVDRGVGEALRGKDKSTELSLKSLNFGKVAKPALGVAAAAGVAAYLAGLSPSELESLVQTFGANKFSAELLEWKLGLLTAELGMSFEVGPGVCNASAKLRAFVPLSKLRSNLELSLKAEIETMFPEFGESFDAFDSSEPKISINLKVTPMAPRSHSAEARASRKKRAELTRRAARR